MSRVEISQHNLKPSMGPWVVRVADSGSVKSIWQQRLLFIDELGPARLAVSWPRGIAGHPHPRYLYPPSREVEVTTVHYTTEAWGAVWTLLLTLPFAVMVEGAGIRIGWMWMKEQVINQGCFRVFELNTPAMIDKNSGNTRWN